jgi:lysophospholipid acyltransferase (LPLAT)-like uncharacterized protein
MLFPMQTKATKGHSVHSIKLHQYLLLLPICLVIRIWSATLRLKVRKEDIPHIAPPESPQIIVFWHNCLSMVPAIKAKYWKKSPLNSLVSASGDGAWLVAFFKILGLKSIRGSQNFRGAQALKELIKVVRREEIIGITPDGSKGPPYIFKPGVAAVAKTCKCPIVLYGFEFSSAWRLKSWDRFFLPKPFSKVTLKIDKIDSFSSLGITDIEEASWLLQQRMMHLMPVDPAIETPQSADQPTVVPESTVV